MKNVGLVVALVTLFAFFYQASPYIGVPPIAIYGMFLASPFLLIWMVYVILKYGKPSGRSFDERFYDDVEV
jgi:hypothetical protein